MQKPQDIYSYVIAEEANYQLPIPINDSWSWSMPEHIKTTVLYKNSQFLTGKDDNKPFKNIIRAILNLQYRAEGFDVKDINIFVEDEKNYYKSFLAKKYHDRWAVENDLDTFIDDVVEAYVDFGGVLVKKIAKTARPEVVPWQSIVFCDQTDILSGPIGIKHFFSPDQLKEMEALGWGSEANGATATIEDVIALADDFKTSNQDGQKAKTPGKYIEVYEIHGNMPLSFLKDTDSNKYTTQLQIICFYQDKSGTKHGITLFKGEEKESPFKLLLRDKIFGRALGFGGAEELFEAQVWVNYDQIRMKGMLDAASKVIVQTNDDTLSKRHPTGLKNLDNLSIVTVGENRMVGQLNTTPVNIALFERSVNEWEAHAQQIGSANDSIMGKNPSSGTPFKLQELVTQESHSLHEYRKGKISTFFGEIYRDWVIPHFSKVITSDIKFLADLDFDEMQYVSEQVANNGANRMAVEAVLNGDIPEEPAVYKDKIKADFIKAGNNKFINIFKADFKSAPLSVKVNIAGKQKDLFGLVDKLTNIMRTIMANPQGFMEVMKIPGAAKAFQGIIEGSGLNPMDFNMTMPTEALAPQVTQANTPAMAVNQ